ncbi:snoRNA-binding rRNA-processing protein utp10 [Recurvomyces mirabilis]|uniref:U3 small nucleolar RNA-associated protein 10 n=1 Tax=Recurvomyces mirabilis TaxID=574656 RepID=A0AAE0WVN4_9PEZI|nr:snoRNA-binding rRNA-processing protein utp10 [Recurvomyces mirabilis]KAK5161212.1 snoRNA-binding rRNA-processing protein utp10 [Recurvomyces mirabilis]
MATALQQQLAAIAANSTHQLDLKAQKTRHSKSLLFESRDAASQSFDTIYQICIEGFEELCMLDIRFAGFGRNLFSEQSKNEDRTQMTAAENAELDKTAESFLGLISGRLLLKPAMKAVEWLVRRFRVQEYNTEAILLTFLPYHTSHIFPTLLSILPEQLPATFRFLHPYVAALQSPPRHAILTAAITNQGFFSAFSQYVLGVARAKFHSAMLLGLWASITAQAVNGMIDTTRSGRDTVRKQREEDLLLRVLPILQSALSIKGVPELYLGACMILTILATKASLHDKVLDAMMEAIAGAWTLQTVDDGLTCLSVLAEEKEQLGVPKAVAKAIQASDGSLQRLIQRHQADGLVLGLAMAAPELLEQADLLLLIQHAAKRKNFDLSRLSGRLALPAAQMEVAQEEEEPESMDIDEQAADEVDTLGPLLDALPAVSGKTSFLGPDQDELFEQYLSALQMACSSAKNAHRVLDLPALRPKEIAHSAVYLTFMARVWLCSHQISARTAALDAACSALVDHKRAPALDLQTLLPAVVVALSDSSQKVRRSAASLCKLMHQSYGDGKAAQVWCAKSIYGERSSSIHHLSSQDANRFVASALLPILDDCVLDREVVSRALAEAIKGAEGSANKDAKPMKQSLRADIATYLASHAVATSSTAMQLCLLTMVNKVGKAGADARKKVLTPFIRDYSKQDSRGQDVDRAVLRTMSSRTGEELDVLRSVAESNTHLASVALERLRSLFSAMTEASQVATADFMLQLALRSSQSDALETLRTLPYTTPVLVHLVNDLPEASSLQDQPSSAKKRRMSVNSTSGTRKADSAAINAAVQRVTLVLELVEGSKPEKHVQLLEGLFHLLGELHIYKAMLDSQLVYLQGLLMSCLLAVVNGLKTGTASSEIDRSVIRADLIVETVRTTSSTQVHNTALLLISSLASWAPDLVLHSVMPLFTFMSTTLLRQGDDFSAHVTDQTVSRIVPPLAASLKKRGKDLVSGASELLLSFTAAFEHIPLHRRSGLFRHLVQTLGPEESLFAVMAMLVERYPDDDRVRPFVSELMSHFNVEVQLRALKQYLDLVFDGLKAKRTLSDTILAFGEKDSEQIEESIDNLLQALATLMQAPALRKRVAKFFAQGGATIDMLQGIYAQLLEQAMRLNRDLVNNDELRDSAAELLASLLRLTPTKDFIESSAQLMQTGSDETRQQVFHALEARVLEAKRGDAELQQTFLEVLPNCGVFVQAEQPVGVRHAAITCMDQIVEKYGKRDRDAVLQAAQAVAGNAALGSEDGGLRVISILCLASMVEVLGGMFIPILPQVLGKVLEYLEGEVGAGKAKDKLQDAAFGFTSAVLDHLPWMYSDDYLDSTLELAGKLQQGDNHAAKQFCSLAATNISASTLLTSLDRTFATIVDDGHQAAAEQYLDTLSLAIKKHKKMTLIENSAALFGILLKAFDLRRTKTTTDDQDYTTIFTKIDTIALETVLKLDDKTFRPFFIRLVDWSSTGLPKKDPPGRLLRATSLYSFAHRFFDQLQSIVTSYASYILEDAASLLTTLPAQTDSERNLLDVLLQALTSNFTNDQDDFWQSPAHFTTIASPLLIQLEKAQTLPSPTITTHVIPAITALAAAASSPDHHKNMNTSIMAYMRHASPEVRLAAVKCERAISERLGLDWLSLLPEMLPFISEAQEDDSEEVEREVLRWVRQVEGVTGESLEGMLQ